jgi:hypothetical protein
MPERVYAEVIKGNDWLVRWTKARRDKGLCVYPDQATQEQYTLISDYVEDGSRYKLGHQKDKALRGADLWVVAHARANKTTLLSRKKQKKNPETTG